eukprot:scaffold112175_cov33-Tisochrysis_lutea.AAC.3
MVLRHTSRAAQPSHSYARGQSQRPIGRELVMRLLHDARSHIRSDGDASRTCSSQLFVDRASINLHSDILEHPDFFWEDDEYLSVYQRVSKYLEVILIRGPPASRQLSSQQSPTPPSGER